MGSTIVQREKTPVEHYRDQISRERLKGTKANKAANGRNNSSIFMNDYKSV